MWSYVTNATVVANNNNKIDNNKKEGESLAVSIAAHPGLHLKPLDAVIGQVPASFCPSGRQG